jgi:predicted Rossmann fold nucleotide-binding protein DprA/Smf involved in DNA uptake
MVLLHAERIALFCSEAAPGDAILRTHDAARRLRDEGATVISGFHSPLEKECLRILLRGKQPIIVCVARSLDGMRITGDLRAAFGAGRILFVSPFEKTPRRITKESAWQRNLLVAALADEAFIAHITPGGQTERLAEILRARGVPILDR